jgi:hypothetical protein
MSDLQSRNEPARTASKNDLNPYVTPRLVTYGTVAALTRGNNLSGDTDGNGTMNMGTMSDRCAKENVVRVGDHPLGIGLYLFNYLPQFRTPNNSGRQFGVMADEVERVLPEAVVIGNDGYKRVNYAMIGVFATALAH